MNPLDAITNGEMKAVIGGKERTLKFGMLTYKLIESQEATGNFDTMGITLWAALMVRQTVNELPADFSVNMALEWMDEMDDEALAMVFALGQKAMTRIKNVEGRIEQLLGQNSQPTGSNSKLGATK